MDPAAAEPACKTYPELVAYAATNMMFGGGDARPLDYRAGVEVVGQQTVEPTVLLLAAGLCVQVRGMAAICNPLRALSPRCRGASRTHAWAARDTNIFKIEGCETLFNHRA